MSVARQLHANSKPLCILVNRNIAHFIDSTTTITSITVATMKVTAAVTESSIDADDERTCFTQTPRVSGRTLAGEAVDQVCARASVLARM